MRSHPAIPKQPNTKNTSSQGTRAKDDNKVEVINVDNSKPNHEASFADVRSALEAHVLEKGAIPKKNLICKYDGNGLIFEETGDQLNTGEKPSIIFADPNNTLKISDTTILSLKSALEQRALESAKKNSVKISKTSDPTQNTFSQTEFDEALSSFEARMNSFKKSSGCANRFGWQKITIFYRINRFFKPIYC